MKSTYCILFAMILAVVCTSRPVVAQTAPQGGRGFAIGPLSVSLTARPNTIATGEFTIVSTGGTTKTRYTIQVRDLRQTPDGNVVMEQIGGGVRSCAPWISIDTLVTLEPGGKEVVQFSIAVPADVEGSYYSVIPVRYIPETTEGTMVVPVEMAIAVRVELQIEGTGPLHVDVSDMTVEPDLLGVPHIEFKARNTGVWTATVEGDILFYDPFGTFPTRVLLPYQSSGEPLKIYPGAEIELRCPITQPMPPGDYRVISRLLLNNRWPSRGEFALTIGTEMSGERWSGILQTKEEHDLTLWVEPDMVELSMPAGASRVVPIKIHNRDTREARAELSVTGFTIETNGFYTFPAKPDTAAGWISVEPAAFNIGPGQRKTILARAVIPKGRKEYETVVQAIRIQATALTEDDGWKSGVDRAVLVVAAGPKASPAKLELAEPELLRSDPDKNPTTALFRVKNVGEKIARFRGTLTLERASGQDLLTVDVGTSSAEIILPNSEREFRLRIPPLDKDSFRVKAEFATLGEERTQQSVETVFTSDIGVPAGL
ncbi:MAG: COG1470 family protein [Candidatus Thorarchaeota archaeon]